MDNDSIIFLLYLSDQEKTLVNKILAYTEEHVPTLEVETSSVLAWFSILERLVKIVSNYQFSNRVASNLQTIYY